jgi:hypothetical protein
MTDVVAVMEEKYAEKPRAWFGHPVRMTVKGKDLPDKTNDTE